MTNKNEFEIASELEREKMDLFLQTFTIGLTNFKCKYSKADSFDNHDILMVFETANTTKKCVGEIKVRYQHYHSGYYLEKQKLDSLKTTHPKRTLLYFCISIAGVYVYNLTKIDFETIKLSEELLPKTSAKASKKIKKLVYTLPLSGNFVRYYELFLV